MAVLNFILSSLNFRVATLFLKITQEVMLNKKPETNRQNFLSLPLRTHNNFLIFFCIRQWLKGKFDENRWETVSKMI